MIIILYFMFSVYTSNALIGSPSAMFELLKEASIKRPVAGNIGGSYLTLKSNYGLIFGVIQLCSGMGTVFLDQGYWQRAIASRPTTAVRAYIMGGMAWFAIPFGFATTLGLAAVALTDNPAYPTYPNNMTSTQVSSGLSAPFAAVALLGKPGAIALLLTLFMAVTSSSSSELIAVSSILTFDVYKMYIKPHATPEELIRIAHIMICVFGVVMAVFACIWNAIGIDLGWLFLVMGLLIGGAVFPAAFAVTWKKQNKWGAICGCLSGLAAGLIAWLVEAKQYYGELTVATTGASYPTLAGNMAGVLTGLIVTVVISYIKPDDFDWEITRSFNAVNTSPVDEAAALDSQDQSLAGTDSEEKKVDHEQSVSSTHPPTQVPAPKSVLPTIIDEEKEALEDAAVLEDPKRLNGALRVAVVSSTVLTLLMLIIIPIPMFLTHYIFSKGFFEEFFALFACAILPIYEAIGFFKDFYRDIMMGK
jgi:Na+/proline symporter